MEIQPSTSLDLNLEIVPNSSSTSSTSMSTTRGDHNHHKQQKSRVFSCNYCKRQFYSSQALGGHQNAHKLERSLAKKSQQMSSMLRHGGPNSRFDSFNGGSGSNFGTASELLYYHDHNQSSVGYENNEMGGYRRRNQNKIMGDYSLDHEEEEEEGSRSKIYIRENVNQDNQLDLSLKL